MSSDSIRRLVKGGVFAVASFLTVSAAHAEINRPAETNASPQTQIAQASEADEDSTTNALTAREKARPEAPADAEGRLERIRKRGRLIVGVKSDYPPWGMVNDEGSLVGMEADLAADVADALGVGLELTAVTTSNRLRKLEDGSIDLVIATMGDTPQRREISGLLQPHYYSSGVDLLTPEDTPFTSWGQLRGRTVCLTAGAYYNRTIIDRYLINPATFNGTRDTQLALRDGRCVGWAYDNTSLARLVQKGEWSNYDRPLPTILSTPWAVAVSQEESGKAWGRFVSNMVAHWHRSGHLLQVEKKWGLPESEFLRQQHEVWSRKDANGGYICNRGPDGEFPDSCLNQQLAQSLDSGEGANNVALFFKNTLGLDLSPLYDSFDRQKLLSGIGMTILLSLGAILGSVGFGILLSLTVRRGHPVVSLPVRGLISVARTTPPILQLYILFFGLGGILASGYGLTLSGFAVAVFVLSLYAGASNAVILSAAMDHLDEEGFGGHLRRVLPAAIERGYEGLVANSVNIVKAAGLASTIAVPEIISSTNSIITDRGNPTAMMNILLIFYFVFVLAVLGLLKHSKGLVKRWLHQASS